MIFPQSSYRRTIAQAPHSNRIPDTFYRRTLHGNHWIFHWCSTLSPHCRTLWFNLKLDRKNAEENIDLKTSILISLFRPLINIGGALWKPPVYCLPFTDSTFSHATFPSLFSLYDDIHNMKLWSGNISPCMSLQCSDETDSLASKSLLIFPKSESENLEFPRIIPANMFT